MTEKERRQYDAAVGNLKIRIGENFGGKNVSSHLKNLEQFYCGACTKETREGIICFLETLQTGQDFAYFLEAWEVLQKVEGSLGTGFSICRKNPYIIQYLLQKTAKLRRMFQDRAYQAVSLLLGMGTRLELDENYRADIQSRFYFLFDQKHRNYLKSYETIREKLSAVTGEAQLLLYPTSGDLHCGGKNPYVFIWKGKQYVYKPRDMRADALLNEALIHFNELLPEELKIPAAGITLLDDEEHTGYMEYVTYAESMSEQNAASYYRKFGALLYFCKIYGVSDLHYENIIATESGPVLIDGECSFQKKITMSKKMNDMSLEIFKYAFLPSFRIENQVNFEVVEDETGAKRTLRFNDPLIRENVLEGFQIAASLGRQGKEKIGRTYAEILGREYLTRIVPVKTGDFYSKMEFCCRESQRRGEMICVTAGEILEELKRIFQGARLMEEPQQLEQRLAGIVERDFFQGDIPMFQVKNENGAMTGLYADGSLLVPVEENGFKISEWKIILKNEIEWWEMAEANERVEGIF